MLSMTRAVDKIINEDGPRKHGVIIIVTDSVTGIPSQMFMAGVDGKSALNALAQQTERLRRTEFFGAPEENKQ